MHAVILAADNYPPPRAVAHATKKRGINGTERLTNCLLQFFRCGVSLPCYNLLNVAPKRVVTCCQVRASGRPLQWCRQGLGAPSNPSAGKHFAEVLPNSDRKVCRCAVLLEPRSLSNSKGIELRKKPVPQHIQVCLMIYRPLKKSKVQGNTGCSRQPTS